MTFLRWRAQKPFRFRKFKLTHKIPIWSRAHYTKTTTTSLLLFHSKCCWIQSSCVIWLKVSFVMSFFGASSSGRESHYVAKATVWGATTAKWTSLHFSRQPSTWVDTWFSISRGPFASLVDIYIITFLSIIHPCIRI